MIDTPKLIQSTGETFYTKVDSNHSFEVIVKDYVVYLKMGKVCI